MLAEREKRFGSEAGSTEELNDKKNNAAQHLLEEIRQAVNEANAKGQLRTTVLNVVY